MRRDAVTSALASILAAAVVAGCAATSGSGTRAEGARRSTLADEDVTALAAVIAAADARRPDTAAIDVALRSTAQVVRASAVRAIGQIGVTARVAVARHLTADPDTMVAADATFALGAMRDSSGVSTLARLLGGPPTVVAAAAWSLGELGQVGRGALESVLRTGQPAAALADVLQASTKLRPVPVALIVPHLTHPELIVRRSAAYALTRTRLPAAARPLLALAGTVSAAVPLRASVPDTAADLRSYVARGLAQAATGDSLASDALVALRRLATDPHPHVRINALRSLASFGAPVSADVIRHLRDGDANVRVALAQVIGDVIANDRTAWMAAWAADSGLTYRRSLLGPALRVGVRLPALAPNGADSWLGHRDWRFRAAAAQAAAGGPVTELDALAVPLLRDPDPRVRSAAYGVVAAWADSSVAASKSYGRAALASALSDPDLFVRATILNALRPRARAPDGALALDVWRKAANDPENDARVAALRVIASAWRADSTSFTRDLRDAIAATPPPADGAERTVGRAISLLQHWPPAARPDRPIQWYVTQVREFVDRDVAGLPLTATIATSRGSVRIRFFGADAPLTVANFVGLARRGYYNGTYFHRVVPNFVAQDGDPRGDGSGGPGYAIRDELNRRWYDRGAVGMALSGPDTGGSQYFLAHSPQPHLDGHYTVFGHVTDGFGVLDAIVQGDRITTITVQ
jgi:cyclophilin family peptidyl-prolyl cis-trans isomerase/HEAT repeat protein